MIGNTQQETLVLFTIVVLGCALGRLRIKNFSLGSIGVLVVALIFGHFGYYTPRDILDLGLLLFVYSAGLQAGPRFFRTFRRSKIHYLSLGFIPIAVAFVVSLAMGRILGLSQDLTVGLFSGALTDTTSLASALDAMHKSGISQSSEIAVGYTLAYPFSMLAVLITMHILPHLLRTNLQHEADKWHIQQTAEEPPVIVKQYKVTNPNCHGKLIRTLNPRGTNEINFSHIQRDNEVLPATANQEVHLGDIITVVAKASLSEELSLFLGEEVVASVSLDKNIVARDILITEGKLTGKSLSELRIFQNYQVRLTHIRRQGMEFVAQGNSVLDIGDQVRIVGSPEATANFAQYAGARSHLKDETNMLPFLSGILMGILIGSIPIQFGSEIKIQLGMTGGAFIVSLLIGHYGKIGTISMYVPQAAKNLCRELGIIFFLAAAGSYAGKDLQSIISQYGSGVLLGGIVVTLSCICTTLLLGHLLFRLNILSTMGIICGSMSNSSALGAIRENYTVSELPALSYTTVYPISLIVKIFAAQLMITLLKIVPIL